MSPLIFRFCHHNRISSTTCVARNGGNDSCIFNGAKWTYILRSFPSGKTLLLNFHTVILELENLVRNLHCAAFTFSKVLHMPVQTSLGGGVPKLPLPPKSQRIPRNKTNAGELAMWLKEGKSISSRGRIHRLPAQI